MLLKALGVLWWVRLSCSWVPSDSFQAAFAFPLTCNGRNEQKLIDFSLYKVSSAIFKIFRIESVGGPFGTTNVLKFDWKIARTSWKMSWYYWYSLPRWHFNLDKKKRRAKKKNKKRPQKRFSNVAYNQFMKMNWLIQTWNQKKCFTYMGMILVTRQPSSRHMGDTLIPM